MQESLVHLNEFGYYILIQHNNQESTNSVRLTYIQKALEDMFLIDIHILNVNLYNGKLSIFSLLCMIAA